MALTTVEFWAHPLKYRQSWRKDSFFYWLQNWVAFTFTSIQSQTQYSFPVFPPPMRFAWALRRALWGLQGSPLCMHLFFPLSVASFCLSYSLQTHFFCLSWLPSGTLFLYIAQVPFVSINLSSTLPPSALTQGLQHCSFEDSELTCAPFSTALSTHPIGML